jgi:hypothetical protein
LHTVYNLASQASTLQDLIFKAAKTAGKLVRFFSRRFRFQAVLLPCRSQFPHLLIKGRPFCISPLKMVGLLLGFFVQPRCRVAFKFQPSLAAASSEFKFSFPLFPFSIVASFCP